MQPQTGTRSRQVRTGKVLYPERAPNNQRLANLVWLLRSQAELEAITQHLNKVTANARGRVTPLLSAVWDGKEAAKKNVTTDAEACRDEGSLLYAWAGTKVFEGCAA